MFINCLLASLLAIYISIGIPVGVGFVIAVHKRKKQIKQISNFMKGKVK